GAGAWSATFTTAQIPATSGNITAVATDAAGNPSTQASRPVTIDLTAPSPPVIAVVAGDDIIDPVEATSNVDVSGTAEANSSVAVTWGSTTHTVSANGAGAWSATFTTAQIPAPGPYTISATATDLAGNTSAAGTRQITVGIDDTGDGGGSFTLMSLDYAIPEPEPGDGRILSIDKLVDDSHGAPGTEVANGGTAGDSTPVLTLTLSDVLGDGESIRLVRDGAIVATTSEPGTSWVLDDSVGIAAQGEHRYTAELVSGGNVIATSDSHLYNFQMV
ncbi:MAG: Ig-like domain-containing protein, partial [Pseudomonadota bacterium]|nr:Ig-like domain-containing protein [Pseudomonadota bacterium]